MSISEHEREGLNLFHQTPLRLRDCIVISVGLGVVGKDGRLANTSAHWREFEYDNDSDIV